MNEGAFFYESIKKTQEYAVFILFFICFMLKGEDPLFMIFINQL